MATFWRLENLPSILAWLGLSAVPCAMFYVGFHPDFHQMVMFMQWLCISIAGLAVVPVAGVVLKKVWGKLPRRARPWPPPFEVGDDAAKGKVVRTSQRFQAGDTIFTEPPLLEWDQNEGQSFHNAVTAFLKSSDDTKGRILRLFCPAAAHLFHGDACGPALEVDLPGPLATRETYKELKEFLLKAEQEDQQALAWRFLCIADQNSTSGGKKSAIFEFFARLNHSCEPNCCSIINEEGDMLWVAANEVLPGQELCTEYLDASMALPLQDTLLLPTALRQERLQRWGFLCGCPRCERCSVSGGLDPERGFECSSCGRARGGRHFAARAGDGSDAEILTPCDACGKVASSAAARLAEEAALAREAVLKLPLLFANSGGERSDILARAVHEIGARCVGVTAMLDDRHWLVRWLAVLAGGVDPFELQAQAPDKLFSYFKICSQCSKLAGSGEEM